MSDPRVNLKNPVLAVMLAFLIPGAGHWYQGRRFKAAVFSFGILTLFIWGLVLGHGQPVYSQTVVRTSSILPQLDSETPAERFSWAYAAQVFVGLPSFPALIQDFRFRRDYDSVNYLSAPFESEFTGRLLINSNRGTQQRQITGRLKIAPSRPTGSRSIKGTLDTTDESGQPLTLTLGGQITLGRRVFGSPLREFQCTVLSESAELPAAEIEGTVSRSFINWFQAPTDTAELDRLHGSLSRQFDVACVFTWIAGLLNLLAIWDAAQGPAYGYGDEPQNPEKKLKTA
ncbi:MAG: hypothetical protein RLZZ458_2949 [Planctomycetota bacterium]